jgi:predicted ATP-grasp superfamily ATP-dependent carboligase
MTVTVLLTIGRLPKALDLARSFKRMGSRVIVADPFRWHLTRPSWSVDKCYQVTAPATDRNHYCKDISDIIAREHVSLVVPVSEETMYVTALRDTLPDGVAMFAMPQTVVLNLHNKERFIKTALAYGLDAPRTFAIGDAGARELADKSDFVIKPIHSCSGRGVTFHSAGSFGAVDTPVEPAIVQERVTGNLYSTFTIARSGRALTTAVYRGAVMSGTVAVCFERMTNQVAIEAWVESFTKSSNYTGFISFDFIVTPEGRAFAIECNPRVTSGVHFVDPDDLAPAIAHPDSKTNVRFRKNLFLQQVYPCLTETQKAIFNRRLFRTNLGYLLTASDVTWSWRDPLPLLSMPVTASQIIARSITRGQSFGEASTFDISWQDPS